MIKLCLILILSLAIGLLGCDLVGETNPAIRVSVSQLITDYEVNESEADKKYEGQTIILAGNIAHYAQINGVIGVYLKGSNSTSKWQIICFIDSVSDPQAYSKLEEGKDVTFIGKNKHQVNKFSIHINDCKFIE